MAENTNLKEHTSLMEPMLPSEGAGGLSDLAIDLLARASRFAGRLNPVVRQSVGELVRSMNCYYSNLIAGHDTHPGDIDRVLAQHYVPVSRASARCQKKQLRLSRSKK